MSVITKISMLVYQRFEFLRVLINMLNASCGMQWLIWLSELKKHRRILVLR